MVHLPLLPQRKIWLQSTKHHSPSTLYKRVNASHALQNPVSQPTDIFRYMDGAFLKKSGLVDEEKDGNTMVDRWKSWERRVGQGNRDEGPSRAHEQRQRKGKSPVTSSTQAEEEEEEVAGWKQVLSKVDALQQSQENLQVTVFEMGQQLHTIQKEHKSMALKWMTYFRKQNIEFTPSPPSSPKA
ncbi:hypothetical protein JCGZ_19491 [Jatropha curcas]|uniref:Uncharacterized protein n=1 Tax=Jatropha curcas TaxID=180498 RepID=A0A067L894_JATCU|nr:hypothetical protein JCGZ_19491 [Jatropha curcas]